MAIAVIVLCVGVAIFLIAYRSRKRLRLCATTLLLLVAVAGSYYFLLPSVSFRIDSRAVPGHMVVEFRAECPSAVQRPFPLQIAYRIPASGYTCSSTELPDSWMSIRFVFYDSDSQPSRHPPLLQDETFFSTGISSCGGRFQRYVHKDLVLRGGQLGETWYDFTRRVGMCR